MSLLINTQPSFFAEKKRPMHSHCAQNLTNSFGRLISAFKDKKNKRGSYE